MLNKEASAEAFYNSSEKFPLSQKLRHFPEGAVPHNVSNFYNPPLLVTKVFMLYKNYFEKFPIVSSAFLNE